MESRICPTDSRRRPDIRALEIGAFDFAASEKERLENRQRDYRKPFNKKKGRNESANLRISVKPTRN
jgi:hypothetical protein